MCQPWGPVVRTGVAPWASILVQPGERQRGGMGSVLLAYVAEATSLLLRADVSRPCRLHNTFLYFKNIGSLQCNLIEQFLASCSL